MSLDQNILNMLNNISIEVLPGDSGQMFYGWAQYHPPKVQVYETNPSRYFPKKIEEVWNQSGMDHELIGHLYNFYAGERYCESEARKTQVEMAKERVKKGLIWKIAVAIEPIARNLQKR